jgi:hypothetical protein
MDLSKIISVSGKGGIFKVIAQGRQALIVESLVDGKRSPVPLSVRISSLDEISMFTTGDDVELKEVFTKIHALEGGKESIDHKCDKTELEAKFKEVLPDYDDERVHTSDIRKVFQWYNLLVKYGEFDVQEEKTVEEKEEKKATTKKSTKKATKKSAKKSTAKTPKPKSAKGKAPTQRKSAQRGS